MSVRERIINGLIRVVAKVCLNLRTEGLDRIPRKGPGIILSNHTTNIEGPLLYVLLQPRPATGLGKIELWENPFTRFFVTAWGLIPLRRIGMDRQALDQAYRALRDGMYLGVAPEGTRSKTGALSQGLPGAAMIAAGSGAPVYPVVHWGLTDLGSNLRRGKRSTVVFRMGRPFRVQLPSSQPGRGAGKSRRRMVDEMMYQLAAALPPQYRGIYSDLSNMTTEYLEFLD